jgi:MinD superfamily P-loop ATPase
MERVLGVCRHFNVPATVCINKYDINETNTRNIEEYCRSQGTDVISHLPYDTAVTEAMVQGMPLVKYRCNGISSDIQKLWETITTFLKQ